MGGRAVDVPGAHDRRIPELLHDHRTRQPFRAVEHGRLDRAARRLGRRLPQGPREEGFETIEPTPLAESGWNQHVEDCAAITLHPTANSWYMGANVPGKPRVFLPYIGGVDAYREACDEVVAQGYLGFRLTGPAWSSARTG